MTSTKSDGLTSSFLISIYLSSLSCPKAPSHAICTILNSSVAIVHAWFLLDLNGIASILYPFKMKFVCFSYTALSVFSSFSSTPEFSRLLL